MGLDQYLLLKEPNKTYKSSLGIMNGYFPLALKSDKKQIGYWRKAYSVSDFILDLIGIEEDHNCVDLPITKDQVKKIIKYAEWVLNTEYAQDDYEERDWQMTLEIFNEALAILEKNPEAELFYKEWF